MIVVDDGSTDRTAEIVRSFARVKYVHQPNAGPAAARNKGVQTAQGKFIFFTDSDCVPHDDWLQKMMPHFHDPKVAAVSGSYGIANKNSWLAQCIHAEILYRHHKLMPQYPKAFGSYNVAIRKAVFESVGGFDTHYRYASGEDNDLSYKIIKAGHKIYFERAGLVDHHHTESLKRYLFEQFRHGYWRLKMYMDHPQMVGGDDYTFLKDILEMPLALFGLIGLALFPFAFSGLSVIGIACLIFLAAMEAFYAFLMISTPHQALAFSAVMFFRAYSRFFFFIFRIYHPIYTHKVKKVQ